MAKSNSGSVAPKERINISYRPANTGAKEKVELPFKVMVLGEFSTEENETPLNERSPVNINRANFDEVLSSTGVSLNFSVPNKLNVEGEDIAVDLKMDSIKDFEPDSILAAVPELKKTIDARNALKALKGPIGNVPGLRKTLKAMLENPESREQLKKELGL
jgi:type VI secretion system protein ImpB